MKKCEIEHDISIDQVVEILKKNGTFVTASEAEIILDFMINLASLSFQTNSNESRFVYPRQH
ncbi:MAG: hypothetical protein IBJ16_07635 [Chitinophagaceae bacterium]|nr:hypothetical protein [Chitinophagaceae bacterium]